MVDDRRKSYQSASSCGWGSRWKSGHVQNKRGLNTQIHLAVDANGMPVRILITEGTRADCKEAVHLIEGISAEVLLADWGYDTNDILAYAVSAGMEALIPPKENRKEEREYDKYLYKLRHLIENCFLVLKCRSGALLAPLAFECPQVFQSLILGKTAEKSV